MLPQIKLKRAYDPRENTDGYRIYIDRLWPQGLSHETFHYNLWDKEIAPSTQLREWFHADPENRWDEFEKLYKEELKKNPGLPQLKETIADKPVVTLLYSSKNEKHNNAVIVKELLES